MKPGVAPIAEQAPRVTSGHKKKSEVFEALLGLGKGVDGRFELSYGRSSARLFWPGLTVSLQELVGLLKTLPRTTRIHGASRCGCIVRSFAYGDKLYRSKLTPPEVDGLVLYWKQRPAELALLERGKIESVAAEVAQANLKHEAVPKLLDTAEPLTQQPATKKDDFQGVELVKLLQNSPQFQAAYQALKDERPPLDRVCQLLELLCQNGGRVAKDAVTKKLRLPQDGLSTLLSQSDTILGRSEEYLLSVSVDQKVLLLDVEGLNRFLCLESTEDDVKVVQAETIEGDKRSVRLPIEVKDKERPALEALLRYGRLSEQELSRVTGSRRIGGLLERLLAKLEGEGFFGLSVVGEGAEGRIFSLQSE